MLSVCCIITQHFDVLLFHLNCSFSPLDPFHLIDCMLSAALGLINLSFWAHYVLCMCLNASWDTDHGGDPQYSIS